MNTFEALFSLLRSEMTSTPLNEEERKSINNEFLVKLYKLSKSHDLAHLIGDALDKNDLLPMGYEATNRFIQERNMSVYRYEQINYELGEISRIFEENKIKHIPLKGSVIRKYYPEPWMRTSGDIDILIKKEDLENATLALEKEGCRYEGAQIYDVHIRLPSGVCLELHFDFMQADVADKRAKVLAQAWERTSPCDGYEYRLKFDNAFFYFYHIAHMVKHFLKGGCGIRPFLDIWLMKQQDHFCGEEIDDLLKETNLLTFAQNAERLSKVWFDDIAHDAVTKEMEEYIVKAGIYGSLDNQIALQQLKSGGKRKHLWTRIFLPFSLLKCLYPKLEKYPVLFPFYQVVRWFRIVFGKNKKRAFIELKRIATTKDDRKKRLGLLCNNLGLTDENFN